MGFLLALHRGYENLDGDFSHNGERFVLKKAAENAEIKIIFDVGANIGRWSRMAAGIFPRADIYSFEIIKDSYERLARNCREYKNIRPYNVGLSDIEGEKDAFFSPDRSSHATCVKNFSEEFHHYQPQRSMVRMDTGDRFCSREKIVSIDYLKIDAEGFEPQALKGFEGMLKAGKIRVIQFEYGYVNAFVKFLLKDFYDYLRPFDMRVGKIYPNHVEFRDYRLQEDNFCGPNYLAVRSSEESLIKALF